MNTNIGIRAFGGAPRCTAHCAVQFAANLAVFVRFARKPLAPARASTLESLSGFGLTKCGGAQALKVEHHYTLSREPLQSVRDYLRTSCSIASLRSREPRGGSSYPHSKQVGHYKCPTCFGGRRGIRTPGSLHFNGFQDRRIRPLCHPSLFYLLYLTFVALARVPLQSATV